jgi:hypothetical protein
MSTEIVVVNVAEQFAPKPATLQQSGAFISQGATTLAPGTWASLPQSSTLATLLNSPLALSGISQSAGTATATTAATTASAGTYNSVSGLVTLTLSADIGLTEGSSAVVSGATGTGTVSDIDGTFVAAVGTGGTTLTYTIAESLTLTITGANVGIGHGITVSDTWLTTIAGAVPAAYNGTFLATAASATTFTYSVPSATSSPATGSPTYTGRNVVELVSMNTTWWAQQNAGNLSPYVLELGPVEDTAAITALGTYIANNPNSAYTPGAEGFFYSYLVPRAWASESSYLTFVSQFNSPTSRTKFWTTMTTSNYTSFTNLNSCVIGLVEAPGIPATEFSLCSGFYVTLNYGPTTTNKVPPLNNSYVFGVTPYPVAGNTALLNAFKAAGVNWISTGAQGGITLTTFVYGTTMDGKSFNIGYSVDWAQITTKIVVANAVINGSNDPTNPLYYDQDGINRLQSAAAGNLQSGIGSGLILGTLNQVELDPTTFLNNFNNGVYAGQCVINAVPFQTWLNANPSTYAEGVYGGFTIVMTPQLGFTQIIFNLDVTEFA